MKRIRMVMVAVLLLPAGACDKGDGGDGSGGGGDTEASGGSSGDPTGDSATSTSGGGGSQDHGHIKVQFRRSDSESESPFVGTQEVEIRLGYGPCFAEFYQNNPNYASDGIDGAPIFADFADPQHPDYLCGQTDATRPVASCEAPLIEQDLDNNRLTARYQILDTDMEDKVLFFGPVPCPVLTVCEGILSAGGGAGTGFGGNGTPLWNTVSFPQRDAACDQGLPIEIRVAK